MNLLPRAVAFDLDDTLLATSAARIRRLRAVTSGTGVGVREALAIGEACFRAYQRGDLTWEEQRVRRWTLIGVPEDQAAGVDEDYRNYYASIRMRRGARSLIKRLRDHGVRLALVSNSEPEYVYARLHQLDLAHAFDYVF